MNRFVGYRPNPPAEYVEKGLANQPDEPQYEGVVWENGSVTVHWLTRFSSHSTFLNFDNFWHIHGHPEYGTTIEWLDGEPAQLSD